MDIKSLVAPTHSLVTPPNSEEIKDYQSFDEPREENGRDDPVLISTPRSVYDDPLFHQEALAPLFGSASPQVEEARPPISPFTPQRLDAAHAPPRVEQTRMAAQPSSPQLHSAAQATPQELETIHRHWRKLGVKWDELRTMGLELPESGPSVSEYLVAAQFIRTFPIQVVFEIRDPVSGRRWRLMNHESGEDVSSQTSTTTLPATTLPATTPPTDALPRSTLSGPATQQLTSSSKRRRSTSDEDDRSSKKPMREARASSKRATKPTGKASGAEHKSARAAVSKVAKSANWEDYPDFAPAFKTDKDQMDAMDVAFKVKEFSGERKSLADDPEQKHLSHPELLVADRLRLNCHKFLCAKRQIFQRYVEILRKQRGIGLLSQEKISNWNKTEAQNAVNIDVTKASYMFEFYKQIGWFEKPLFEQYMQ